MYCTHCGEKVNTTGKYCSNCGKKCVRKSIAVPTFALSAYAYLREVYLSKIVPHREKIIKFTPMIAGILAASAVMVFIIIPAYGRVMFDKGKEYISQMRYGEAVAAFSQASVAGVTGPEISAYMGEAYINLEEYGKALKSLEQESGDSTPAQLKLLADVWNYEGEEQKYESVLIELMRMSPNDEYAYLKLSDYYRQKGFYDNASATLEKLLARQKNADAASKLYNIYMESHAKSVSAKKASDLQEEAMKSFGQAAFSNLSINSAQAISVSQDGEYIALKSKKEGKAYIEIYSYTDTVFKFHSSFKVPGNYYVGADEITWSSDNSMLAFYNGKAEDYVYDSSIYIYNLAEENLYNLSDPGTDYIYYVGDGGVFIIDSLPCFSEDNKTVYFARRSVKGNWLCAMDLAGNTLTNLYEPADGGFIDYKIIEKDGTLFFSVRGDQNNPLWGIYAYDEANGANRLKFPYDDRYYFLALKEISPDGKYLMYHVTVADQNNSIYIGIVDLETMKPVSAYPQEIDSIDGKMYALNKTEVFGAKRVFITRNASFSLDSKSVYVAEQSLDAYGKLIRRFSLDSGSGDFVYLSFSPDGAETFCAPDGALTNASLAQLSEKEYIVYDNGLKVLAMGQ